MWRVVGMTSMLFNLVCSAQVDVVCSGLACLVCSGLLV
jgi:hypothetical protein